MTVNDTTANDDENTSGCEVGFVVQCCPVLCKREWLRALAVHGVLLALYTCCVRGFAFGQSGWVAERLESLMVFMLICVLLLKVRFAVI